MPTMHVSQFSNCCCQVAFWKLCTRLSDVRLLYHRSDEDTVFDLSATNRKGNQYYCISPLLQVAMGAWTPHNSSPSGFKAALNRYRRTSVCTRRRSSLRQRYPLYTAGFTFACWLGRSVYTTCFGCERKHSMIRNFPLYLGICQAHAAPTAAICTWHHKCMPMAMSSLRCSIESNNRRVEGRRSLEL